MPFPATSYVLLLTGLVFSTTILADEHKAYVQFNVGAAFAPSFTFSDSVCNRFFGCKPSSYQEDYNAGFAGGLALGYRLAEQIRFEVEALYQTNAMNKFDYQIPFYDNQSGALNGDRERSAFLFNAYYDFKNTTNFTPYITGGLGAYHLRLNYENVGVENSLNFAWQAGAGVNYKVTDRFSLDLKYRYFGGSGANLRSPNNSPERLYEVGDHQIMVGLRVGF